MQTYYPQTTPVARGGTAFGGILIFAFSVAIFYVYLNVSLLIRLAPTDWMVETASGAARAPGGASHPLLFVVHYLVAYAGNQWLHILPGDSLNISQKFLSALGAAFFGGYLLQRFKSLLVAFGGMMILAFSFVYWRGTMALDPHQLALMLFLAAMCCVGEPSYGRDLIRLRDLIAAILLTLSVLASQYFILFVPAFCVCSSERWEPRIHFISVFAGLYIACSIGFLVFYLVGPPGLFTGTTLQHKIGEWIMFRPTEGARLVLDTSAAETAQEASEKLAIISVAGLQSVLAGSYNTVLAFALWFGLGVTALAVMTVDSVRREGSLVLLIAIPTLASIYLQANVGIERYLPLSLGFALLASALLGYFALSSSLFLRLFGPLLLFLFLAPSFAFINYRHLTDSSRPAEVPAASQSATAGQPPE